MHPSLLPPPHPGIHPGQDSEGVGAVEKVAPRKLRRGLGPTGKAKANQGKPCQLQGMGDPWHSWH
eukprot:4583869-Pyramimonas_sp.AAC.1